MGKRRGFTLIEMLVALGLVSGVMITVSLIMFNLFQGTTKVAQMSLVEENGNSALEEIRKNIASADLKSGLISCGGNYFSFYNRSNGIGTTLVCTEGSSIASRSGSRTEDIWLTNSKVSVSGCNGFVTCDLTGLMPVVEVKFTLESKGAVEAGGRDYASKFFGSKVVVRR
jgi:prepilin-type N-terminal cleavage/methylation domain-containing protein